MSNPIERAFADRLLEVWPHLNSRSLMT